MVMLTVLRKAKMKEREMRVLFLGLDNSGKTTLLKKLNGEDIGEVEPTFGFNIKTLEYKQWRLNCWDVGGQKSLRTYWRNHFERTDAVIWVVDTCDVCRMADCAKELHSLVNEESLFGVTLLVMANKRDLDGSVDAEQIKKLLDLDRITKHHWRVYDTSAYTGSGVLEAMDWMCEDVNSRVLVPD